MRLSVIGTLHIDLLHFSSFTIVAQEFFFVQQPICILLWLLHQFLFAGTHMRDDIASEAYEDELDMGRSGSYLNSSITSAWSEHSLDPEDIRVRSVSLNLFYSPLFNIFLTPPKILSHGSFLLQTPDEMGHLSSINGCGVRSCDSHWEKRTNVSRDFCLSVRAEEVSTKRFGQAYLPEGIHCIGWA